MCKKGCMSLLNLGISTGSKISDWHLNLEIGQIFCFILVVYTMNINYLYIIKVYKKFLKLWINL